MGQAFDRDGNVLGEAYGETKREVLDKLELMHPTAEEIRIKTLRDKVAEVEQKRDSQPDRMLQYFQYRHLPAHLQSASKPFCDLAEHIASTIPANPERTVALRKLLEAKDCAVRALL
jgi:hypothetical protein